MSESPTYKKIRDLDEKIDPDSGDELPVSDKDTLATNRISINNIVKSAFSHSTSVFETDVSGNLVLKNNAIDGSKIVPGTIKSEQLAPNSITAEQLSATAVQENLVTNKTSKTTLVDSSGIVQTISSTYYGTINLMVNSRTDGLAFSNSHEDGPNPRDFDNNHIDGNIITVEDHGLINDGIISISTKNGSVFPESSPIIEGENLFVSIIDKDTFRVSKTSGGNPLNLGPGWSGDYVLNRETIVSIDISAYVSNNTNSPKFAPTVNYNFSTVESAYSWCARNANLTFLNLLIGHHSNPDSYWNEPGTSSRLSLDREFVKPKVLSIYGNRSNGTDRATGWISKGSATSKTNYHAYNRARLTVYPGSSYTLPLWFRGQSELKLAHFWWIFDYENSAPTNQFMNLPKAIVHWTSVSCEAINRNGGSIKVMNVGENANVYLMGGGTNYFGGLTSHEFLYVAGFSTAGVGMPKSSTYVVTEVGGSYAKKEYISHSAATWYHGRYLNNSTGAFSDLQSAMDGSTKNDSF